MPFYSELHKSIYSLNLCKWFVSTLSQSFKRNETPP